AAVGSAICALFFIQVGFFLFQIGAFAGGQLSALDALANALLLQPVARVYFIIGLRLCLRVVLLLVDVLAQLVLLVVEFCLVGGSEFAAIGSAHVALLGIQVLLFVFQFGSFACGQRAILYAVANSFLLIVFALLNGLTRYGRAGCGGRAALGKRSHRCQ